MNQRGRPLSYDPDRVLDQAMQIFWQHGYESTSLQDLLQATGLSKSSLYQAYGSKLGLFRAAFAQYCQQRASDLRSQLLGAPQIKPALAHWLLSAAEESQTGEPPRGCMLVNVASEFSQSDPEIALLIQRGGSAIQRALRDALQQAVARGELADTSDPAALAAYLQCLMSGLRTQVKSGAPREAVEAVVNLALQALD